MFSAAQKYLFQSVAQVVGVNGPPEISTDKRPVEQSLDAESSATCHREPRLGLLGRPHTKPLKRPATCASCTMWWWTAPAARCNWLQFSSKGVGGAQKITIISLSAWTPITFHR